MWAELCAIFACVFAAFYIYVKKCHRYWESNGIPHLKPTFFVGNLLDSILGKKTLFQDLDAVYKTFKDCKYAGIYKFLDRIVMIRDPQLLNEMLVKDFQHFSDNEMSVDEKIDYIMAKNIFVLKGHQWKHTRSLLTPMFSSGKLKYIFPLSEEVSQRMSRYIKKEIEANCGKCVDGKNLCTRYTIDNVANCAFGIDARAFDGESKFFMVVQEFNDMSYLTSLKMMLLFMFPRLNSILKVKLFKEEVEDYLTEVVGESLKHRKANNIVRNDFLDQINSLKEKSVEYPFTDRDVVAQGAGFFIDGVETSAGVASYVLAEIGRHQDVQKEVREEIRKVKAAHNGEMTYEGLQELEYLDTVINETLRMNSPGGGLMKLCTKPYTLPEVSETNQTRLELRTGDIVMVPIDGIHYDPNYFPEPNEFRPERFSEANKDSLVKNTFIPFGLGPRHCIGFRFGIIQVKLIVCAVIGNYQLDINPKMLPYKTHPKSFLKAPLNGFWFDLSKLPEDK